MGRRTLRPGVEDWDPAGYRAQGRRDFVEKPMNNR
jgi:hypothetical protein